MELLGPSLERVDFEVADNEKMNQSTLEDMQRGVLYVRRTVQQRNSLK